MDCVACGKSLHSALGLRRRYGRRCWDKVQRASRVLARSSNKAARKAAVCLQEGTARRVAPGLYSFPSSGSPGTFWTASSRECDCLAGSAGRLCYHRVVVEILLA